MAKDKDDSMFGGAYQSALDLLADQIRNRQPIQIDPHLPNLVSRYFALPEMWPKDWDTNMKKGSQRVVQDSSQRNQLGYDARLCPCRQVRPNANRHWVLQRRHLHIQQGW
jgi:hypothetical protein